jgi:hypothetical protein
MQDGAVSCGCSVECASEEPIVCTLDGREQAARGAEFRDVFAHLLTTQPFDGGFRWHFRAVPGLEERLVDLARREHDCCRFFRFRVGAVGEEIVWEARTDSRATSILEELMRLPETLREADIETIKSALHASGLAFSSDTTPR